MRAELTKCSLVKANCITKELFGKKCFIYCAMTALFFV